jgi:hypothetical protein
MTKEKILSILKLDSEKGLFFCKTDYLRNYEIEKLLINFVEPVSDKVLYRYKQDLFDTDYEVQRVDDRVISVNYVAEESPNIPFIFNKNLK